MKWSHSRLYNVTLIVLFFASLIVFFINTSGCTGTGCAYGPGITDDYFVGTWEDSNVELRVGHVSTFDEICERSSDYLHIHGFNNQTGAVWDRLAFTGEVIKKGGAKGNVSLWSNETLLTSFQLELTHNGNKQLSFDLNYTANNRSYQEHYELQRNN